MSNLFLDSLEVHNFRGLRSLEIKRFGRVNLIVGENSVGKTSLLESLWVYANQGSFQSIRDILQARSEYTERQTTGIYRPNDEEDALASGIKYLFYGRKDLLNLPENIKIGPIANIDKTLTLAIGWYIAEYVDQTITNFKPIKPENKFTLDNAILALSVQLDSQLLRLIPLDIGYSKVENNSSANNFIQAIGLRELDVSRFWSQIALTQLEDDVIKALKIVIPKIERVTVVSDSSARIEPYSAIAKLSGTDSRVPLRSLGDGISRIFGIILALVNSKNGILLIDEIENGLHYSIQAELWKLILEVAARLNIQVFATTHSSDCIRAFQEATANSVEEGILVRLENRDNRVLAVLVDEKALEIATARDIEVR